MNAPTALAQPSPFFRLPVNLIKPSHTAIQNLRRSHFDAAKLGELAESIKVQGLLQPILVRPIVRAPTLNYTAADPTHEIVAGERRWLAAKQAGLTEIDCHVRELTDAQLLEAQLVENLQREDVSPLEEAEGYKELLKLKGIKAEDLGAQIGKSRAYVYARMKLLDLCDAARKYLSDGVIDASIALEIARVPDASLQNEACKNIADNDMTFADAKSHIDREIMPVVKSNEAVAAARKAGKPVIDGDAAKKIWPHRYGGPNGYVKLDDDFWSGDKNKKFRNVLDQAPDITLVVNPHTDIAEECVLITTARKIFTEKKLPLPYLIKPAAPTKTIAAAKPDSATQAKEKAEREKEQRKLRLQSNIITAIAKATRAKYPPKLGKPELLGLVELFSDACMDAPEQDICGDPEDLDLSKLNEKQLVAVVLDHILMTGLDFVEEQKKLLAAAKRYGVKADKIKADMTAAFNAAEKAAKTPAPAAAKAVKKAGKK